MTAELPAPKNGKLEPSESSHKAAAAVPIQAGNGEKFLAAAGISCNGTPSDQDS
jgi:hypothetical protein